MLPRLRTRTAVIQRAVELLAESEGLDPFERLPADKFHPWCKRGAGRNESRTPPRRNPE